MTKHGLHITHVGHVFREVVFQSLQEYFPEDEMIFDASISYAPTDDGALLPIGVVYLQINGTESVDGLYLIDTIPPSMISKESIDAVVAVLAAKSSDRRAEIRAAMARGEAQEAVGLPKDAQEV